MGNGESSNAHDLFSDEVILPSQYADTRTYTAEPQPERRLLYAIVDQAKRDLHAENPLRALSTAEWFIAKDLSYCLSFSSICLTLGASPRKLRRFARASMKARGLWPT